ncbi:MAG: Phospholipid-binding lipoprotein MlaA [Hydrocarboniphaga sp.]|uniref:MlaA family lipoprotein n=1 Tax=Hydrocarboniphaga sp. TaxID=2033016 RepID=UPI00262F9ECB|nr:VacJ family lipoprotein [Hydrocarboniphaga sp.]MDB5970989.1 Phospholipid-binding lipoprotein MlaA [Hydrocarboniphaga sp.]
MGKLLLCVGLVLGLGACAHSPSFDPADPLEKINRPIFNFNLKADQYVLRPVAKAYVQVVPDVARLGVSNFFDNLFYPTTIVNDLLQAKFVQGGQDTLRFVLNTTIGLAGFIDVATSQGVVRHDEDLGQTFGRWGVGEGWYLMLPLLGPSDNRDLLGKVGDHWTQIPTYVDSLNTWPATIAINAADLVDTRARLLGSDHVLNEQLDKYVFVRSAYLDRRQSLVFDGHPPEEDLGFDENADDSAAPAAAAKTADDSGKKKKKKKKPAADAAAPRN